jgi:hypothetical protein
MFQRHVFTCPDVIYLLNRQKKINRLLIGANLIAFGGFYIYGRHLDKQDTAELHIVENIAE